MTEYKIMKFIDTYGGIPVCIIFGILAHLRNLVKRSAAAKTPHNVLIITPPAIGDAVLLIPSLRAIRNDFAGAHISVIAYPINKEIFNNCPYLNEILIFENSVYLRNPFGLFHFLRKMRKVRYDLVMDFGQWLRTSALIAYLSKGRRRIGFKTSGQYRHFPFTEHVFHRDDCHEIECFFDIVRALNIKVTDASLQIFLEPSDTESVDKLLRRCRCGDFLIGVHPGGPTHGGSRKWDVEKFALLCDKLIEKYNAEILFTGDKNDVEQTHSIVNSMQHQSINLVDRTSLTQLATVIRRCKLFICGNTGVMHIAAALGTPLVALHGPTNPKRWGPLGTKHVIVQKKLTCGPCLSLGWEYNCKTGECMKLITVDDVINAVEIVIG